MAFDGFDFLSSVTDNREHSVTMKEKKKLDCLFFSKFLSRDMDEANAQIAKFVAIACHKCLFEDREIRVLLLSECNRTMSILHTY